MGHWEGDTVIGAGHSQAVVTLVERKSGYAKLIKVANKTAEMVSQAIEDALRPLSARVKTLTVDNGKEFAYHQKVDHALGIQTYFADPYSSWQRGSNENFNGLLRQYIPKKRPMNTVTAIKICLIIVRTRVNQTPFIPSLHHTYCMSSSSVTDALVELKEVTFGYAERLILKEVSLKIPRGKVTALMGASGGGKTTLLRLIGGQNRASQGRVLFEGADIGQMSRTELFAARRRMGMLFQFGALFTDLSVFENVAFPLREHSSLSDELIRDIVLMKLDAVGLRGARDLMPSEISGGMSRRVALARAMALDPALIMYDEPFAGLDPISLGTAARLIRKLNDSLGITSVIVSHDLEETFSIADQVIILANGRIAAQGTPQEVRESQDPLVAQFVHAQSDGPVSFHYPAASPDEDYAHSPGDRHAR